MDTILVTGATGTIGSRVVAELGHRRMRVRALVRDPERASFAEDVEVKVGSFGNASSLHSALAGVKSVFLACGNSPTQVPDETTVIDAATAAGVRRIVKLSANGAEPGSSVPFWDAHARIEAHLRSSGTPFVLLRPQFFMTNLFSAAPTVQGAGALFLPAAGARIAMVDPRDVAAVAAAALTGEGHDGRSYQLTGPASLSFNDVASTIADVLGRDVSFIAVPDETAFAQLVEAGLPEQAAGAVVATFMALRRGAGAQVTDLVRVLTGREPRTLRTFLLDHAPVFTAEPALDGAR